VAGLVFRWPASWLQPGPLREVRRLAVAGPLGGGRLPARLARWRSRSRTGLVQVLSSRWLLDLPGYNPARCGDHVASL